jgi:hypothetical protein
MKLEGNAWAPPRCVSLNGAREFGNPRRLYKSAFGAGSRDPVVAAHQWHTPLGCSADFLRVMEIRADRGSVSFRCGRGCPQGCAGPAAHRPHTGLAGTTIQRRSGAQAHSLRGALSVVGCSEPLQSSRRADNKGEFVRALNQERANGMTVCVLTRRSAHPTAHPLSYSRYLD